MKAHKNGWPVIERLLAEREKRQADLARAIGVSFACITQVKHGDYSLSPETFIHMLNYLGATADDRDEFYTSVVNARFFDGVNKTKVELRRNVEPGKGLL